MDYRCFLLSVWFCIFAVPFVGADDSTTSSSLGSLKTTKSEAAGLSSIKSSDSVQKSFSNQSEQVIEHTNLAIDDSLGNNDDDDPDNDVELEERAENQIVTSVKVMNNMGQNSNLKMYSSADLSKQSAGSFKSGLVKVPGNSKVRFGTEGETIIKDPPDNLAEDYSVEGSSEESEKGGSDDAKTSGKKAPRVLIS